ncbi:MAG: hypothetical protein ACOH2M_03400 [Cypionkella sp.]
MTKLSMIETNAARWLARNSPFCPGDMIQTPAGKQVKAILDGLVRKRVASADMGDDGPVYYAREMANA